MAERKNSEARIRANNKYNASAYDRINVAVPKGRKEVIQASANAAKQSINAFVSTAIEERIERMENAPDGQGATQ